jgi:hypothetical protein
LVYFLNRRSIWSNLLHFSKCLPPQTEENFCKCLTLGGKTPTLVQFQVWKKHSKISAMVGADTTTLKKPTSLQFILGMCDHFNLPWLKTPYCSSWITIAAISLATLPSQKRLSHLHKPKDNWGEKFQ